MDSLLPENRDFGRIDADPLQPFLEHHYPYPSRDDAQLVQLSALWHPAPEHFIDDARGGFPYNTPCTGSDLPEFWTA